MKIGNPTDTKATISVEYTGTENLLNFIDFTTVESDIIYVSKKKPMGDKIETLTFELNLKHGLNCLISLSSGNVYYSPTFKNWAPALDHQKVISKEVILDGEKLIVRGEFIFIEDTFGDPYAKESYRFEIVLEKIDKDFKYLFAEFNK